MLRTLFVLVVFAVFAWHAIGSVYAAMLMYWWFGIFRPQEWVWHDLSALHLPLLTAALFLGTALLKGYYPRASHPIAVLMVLYLIAASIASLNGCVSYEAVTLSYVITLAVVVLITERVLHSARHIWGLLFLATVSLAYFNAELGYNALRSGISLYGIPIARGSFSDTNSSALGASMGFFLLLFVVSAIGSGKTGTTPAWLRRRHLRLATRALLWFFVVGSLVFIYKTESRGAALSLALGLAFWILLHPRKIRIVTIMCVIAIAILTVGVPQSYKDRIDSSFAESDELESSAASRPHFWAIAVRMAEDYPLGVGIGCYKSNYNNYDRTNGLYGRNRSVHSSHYSVLAEAGYLGLILWLLMLVTTFITLLRVRARASWRRLIDPEQEFYFRLSNAFFASMVVFVSGGNFYEMAYNDYTWLIFGITIAMSRLQSRSPVGPATAAPADLPDAAHGQIGHGGRR